MAEVVYCMPTEILAVISLTSLQQKRLVLGVHVLSILIPLSDHAMQTNVLYSLPRKRKFPDQKLGVLLEILNFPKTPSPRLELHPFSRPPTGINHGFMAGGFWLALLFPVVPLLACPAFRCPGRLLSLSRPLSTPGLFLRRQIFRSFFLYEPF